MREMKDSGVEWIGTMPQEWNTIHFWQAITRMGTGLNPRDNFLLTKDDELFYVTIRNFKDGKLYLDDNCDRISKKAFAIIQERSDLRKGDILFASISKEGQAYVIKEDPENWNINESVFCIRVNKRYYYPKFFYYVLINDAFYSSLRIDATGTTFQSIKQNKLRTSIIVHPPLEMQTLLADYLNLKCAAIDNIIAKQEQIIERLKEYKSSIITEAVTKGLDSRVEMKDSGILSIGCIPKHWIALKLKYLFEKGDNGLKIGPFGSAMKGKTLEQGPYKIYNQAHLIQNDFSLSRHFVSEETFNELKNYEVVPGDILFSMMGTVGKCQIMPQGYPKGIMDSHLLKARLNDRILPEFFVYAYDKDYSYQAISQLLYISNGTIMNGLNSSILKNVVIALPPMEEQKQIIKYIKSYSEKIDKRIAKLSTMVEKLNIYKKSLIYEVVTGKKEV